MEVLVDKGKVFCQAASLFYLLKPQNRDSMASRPLPGLLGPCKQCVQSSTNQIHISGHSGSHLHRIPGSIRDGNVSALAHRASHLPPTAISPLCCQMQPSLGRTRRSHLAYSALKDLTATLICASLTALLSSTTGTSEERFLCGSSVPSLVLPTGKWPWLLAVC